MAKWGWKIIFSKQWQSGETKTFILLRVMIGTRRIDRQHATLCWKGVPAKDWCCKQGHRRFTNGQRTGFLYRFAQYGRFCQCGCFYTVLFGGLNRPGAAPFDPEEVIPEIGTHPNWLNNKPALFYISVGEQDPRLEPTKKPIDNVKSKGLRVKFTSFPGAHEWQVWRKSLHDFAQNLFQ